MKKNLLGILCFSILHVLSFAQCSGFYDGFESGTFGAPWAMGTGTYTMTVPSSGAAVGNYYLSMSSTGANSFYQGPIATFTPSQPTYISWWMKTDNGTSANGYFVVGDANVATDNGILFCYNTVSSSIRFFASTGYNYPVTLNTWHHIEAMNLNWTSRTMDIYVDGVLILSAWPFRSASATSVDRVLMHSLNAANVGYDDIIIGNAPPSLSSTFTSPLCNGMANGSIDLTASGGSSPYTYSWSTGATSQDISALTAGSYSVIVTGSNGCTATQTVVVTEPAVLNLSTTQTDVLCFGGSTGSAVASVSGGTPSYSYLWSPPGGTSPTASNLVAGSYTCTVADANGCTTMQTVTITQPGQPLMTAAANGGNICPGDTATLIGTAFGGTMNYTFTWMPGNMNGSFATDLPGSTTTYTLLVTDANGCTDTSMTTVIVYPAPVVNLGSDFASCGNAMLDAGNPGDNYSWSEGSTTQMIGVSSSGAYDVLVTDGNGCTGRDTVNVTINPLPTVVGSASMNFVCTGEPTVNLFGSPAGGTWSGNGVFGNTFEPDSAGVGTHNIIYTFTDSLGCTGMDTVSITVDLCLGVANATTNTLNVYPNPNSGTFMIQSSVALSSMEIQITDVRGRVVYQSMQQDVTAGAVQTISLNDQPDGIYILQVRSGEQVTTCRITVAR